MPAAEVAGRPTRGRGIAFERRVAATGPASGGVWGEPLPNEASQAPGGRMASAAPTRKLQCGRSPAAVAVYGVLFIM